MTSRFLAPCGVVLLAVVMFSRAADATIIGVCATDNPGQCSKSLTLGAINPADPTHRSLEIVLTNTGGASNGTIVGDAFNIPGNVTPSNLVVSNTNFTNALTLIIGPIQVSGAEVGNADREFSLGLDANWNGSGGSTTGGIPPGGTATYTLLLTGSAGDIAALTEIGIFASQAIRVKGAADNLGGSDKDLVTVTTAPVPEPTTLLLLGGGLVGVAHMVRKRRIR